jgi:FkbM family methyltransferase
MKFVHGWAFPDDDEHMAAAVDENGHYQARNMKAALKYVKQFGVAVDAGAHVGTWSVELAKLFGRVLAFEPAADTREALAANVDNFAGGNIEIHAAALGKEAKQISMTLEGFQRAIDAKNTGARFVKDGGDVPCITLDSLNLEKVGFLKMDIEGSEPDALLGARETLKRCRPVVLFEDKFFWKRYGHERNAPQKILGELGARHVKRVGCDEIWSWNA